MKQIIVRKMLRLHPYPTAGSPKLMRWTGIPRSKLAVRFKPSQLPKLFLLTTVYWPTSVECQGLPVLQVLIKYWDQTITRIQETHLRLLWRGEGERKDIISVKGCNYYDSINLHFLFQAPPISFNRLQLSFAQLNIYFPHKGKVVSVPN
jgi:hypothetical protein